MTNELKNLTVVAFESRMSLVLQRKLEGLGATALVAPSMKEVPIAENPKVFDFFEELEAGRIDLLILLTGVATRTFISTLETKYPQAQIIRTLATKTKIVVRGPKPTAVCKMHNIPIFATAPEPNTWREILTILEEENCLQGRRVGVLEYGISNTAFLQELEQEGASVIPVPVYQWALPDDLGPLNRAIDAICNGEVDLALFTSANQADNMLRRAQERGIEAALRRGFYRTAIFSIGPVCSEKLSDLQFFPDEEVFPNKLDALVELAAKKGGMLAMRKKKRASVCEVRERVTPREGSRSSRSRAPSRRGRERETRRRQDPFTQTSDSPILRACRGEKNKTVPIWLMRQAGRYMAEYQMVRGKVGFLELCKDPDLAAEVTISAVERLGVDAAIIFSDILLPLEAMGVPLEYRDKEGPVIGRPARDIQSIENLRPVDPHESLGFVLEAIRKTRKALHPQIPLISFCGAPFTMASYLIEGKGSRNYIPTKVLMKENPSAWKALMKKLVMVLTDFLNAQVIAGADLLQVFDSWVGCLSPEDYKEYVLPHTKKLILGIKKGTPVIHFGTGTGTLLELQKQAGGGVIGVDWRVNIKDAARRLGKVGIMGNLDPVILFSKPEVIRREAKKILQAVGKRPGFIFNLGHGILPETPVDHVMALVDFVHEWKVR
ncbi:MAG: uroporphyrinogen decarboxylase [Deltaproteobacteria bacterium]|nr:uroporphyrinogen decarboxylase [Deltaproteobacteria bacterium]